jgi:hypothetical protein
VSGRSLAAVQVFRYAGYDVDIDDDAGVLRCRYHCDGHDFEERISVDGGDWANAGVDDAARLTYLLAGVSYYKAFAAPTIDLGDTPVSDDERSLLRMFYVDGLGEYAHRNGIDLDGIELTGGTPHERTSARRAEAPLRRPLVPFGGGMDSMVSVEIVKAAAPDEAALFVVGRYDAIEAAAATTGLPVRRATRTLDPKILESTKHGWRNGHVPVTGIISAIAVLAAALHGHDCVVMSNERSASDPTLTRDDGTPVNHQWSKSIDFERAFGAVSPVAYFSLLRAHSELLIAQRFAEHGTPEQHATFRSCNRAFHVDPAKRLDRWCGECDKCAFIDLVLAPFMARDDLDRIFAGHEPLENEALLDVFRALVGTSDDTKPWECVGDVDECRAAVQLIDRPGNELLDALRRELPPVDPDPLLRPSGQHLVPAEYAAAAGLV